MELKTSIKEDFVTLAEIYKEEFSKPPYNEDWTKEKTLFKINKFSEEKELYSIFSEGEIVGFIVIDPNFMCPGEVAFGEEIAITERYQRKGIGTEVFEKIFKIYKERGFKKFVGIKNLSSKANNLYPRLGLVQSKTDVIIEKKL